MTRLSVNINKVALLRNSRQGEVPSPLAAARTALEAGAAGVTVHPRPDQRHIRPADVDQLSSLLTESPFRERELNMEGNPFVDPYPELVQRVQPHQCTLVPDTPDQRTSDHGWNLSREGPRLEPILKQLQNLGCRVSLFMSPDPSGIERAATLGVDRVELYTEGWASAFVAGDGEADRMLERYRRAAERARELDLGLNAGHDLNLRNLGRLLTIGPLHEVSIGHALIADALWMGLARAVEAYLDVLESGS